MADNNCNKPNPCEKKDPCEQKKDPCEKPKVDPCEKKRDCEGCQADLKAHLKTCCDYGVRPTLIEKCSDLPGGCSTPMPTNCPVPAPKPCCPVPAKSCNTPPTTFTCPSGSNDACGATGPSQPAKPATCCSMPPSTCPPPKPACAPAPPACPPPAPASGSGACGAPGGSKTNDCDPRPLSMTRDNGSSGCGPKC